MQLLENVNLKRFNTFGVEARARYLALLEKPEDALALRDWLGNRDLPVMVLGEGSNVLFRRDYPGVIAHPAFAGVERLGVRDGAVHFRAAAGQSWHGLVMETIGQGIAGLENLSLIPGTVGAAPVQNIGAYGVELSSRFFELEAIDLQNGARRRFDRAAAEFGYRDSHFKRHPDRYLILNVTLALPERPDWRLDYGGLREALADTPPQALTARRISDAVCRIRRSKLPDPARTGNAGSFFKNPVVSRARAEALKSRFPELPVYSAGEKTAKLSAAWMIEYCGWKGRRRGAAGVSSRHALVLVNHGGASGEQIWRLARDIQASVLDAFGVELTPEPRIAG